MSSGNDDNDFSILVKTLDPYKKHIIKIQCLYCHSWDVKYQVLALRSADEGMVAVYACRVCKKSWK
jgi:DNA-directed RNA polymerase subunit M/transcription elongation factor TFIIS